MDRRFDIILPETNKYNEFNSIIRSVNMMLTDLILYLSYGIAILSGLKIIIHILNGFTSKPDMGAASLDNTSFNGRKNWS
jgi:hypothetical protein